MILRIVILLLFLSMPSMAGHLHPEKYYQNIWCKENKGIQEYKLIDDTRVDCLTKTHAVEFDFASKWAESIGQSLHYAMMTNKKAAIVLIIENRNDFKYYNKIKPLCSKYDIALSYMEPPKTTPQYSEIIIDIDKLLKYLFKRGEGEA